MSGSPRGQSVSACRVCDASITPFMSFGHVPVANGFVTPEQFGEEYYYELAPAFCEPCGTFQIIEQPSPAMLFHNGYAFFSGTSQYMARHFRAYAQDLQKRYLQADDPFVVEIGSNDGILIGNFAAAGVRHLGVEPSANVADASRERGIDTLNEFFGPESAERIVAERGPADAVVAANVFSHIADAKGVVRGIDLLLAPHGVLVFEEPYLGAVIEKGSYDQIYDEHVFLLSLRSVAHRFAQADLEIVDAEPQATHGGSMRYTLARQGVREPSAAVAALRGRESEIGLDRSETFDRFRTRCERSRNELRDLLGRLTAEGKRVAGYGATAKSSTVLHYCDLGAETIDFIVDITPTKQGRYTPGSHIPIVLPETFHRQPPDYTVLFAWNHQEEIFAKEQSYVASGGRWIGFVPDVRVLDT